MTIEFRATQRQCHAGVAAAGARPPALRRRRCPPGCLPVAGPRRRRGPAGRSALPVWSESRWRLGSIVGAAQCSVEAASPRRGTVWASVSAAESLRSDGQAACGGGKALSVTAAQAALPLPAAASSSTGWRRGTVWRRGRRGLRHRRCLKAWMRPRPRRRSPGTVPTVTERRLAGCFVSAAWRLRLCEVLALPRFGSGEAASFVAAAARLQGLEAAVGGIRADRGRASSDGGRLRGSGWLRAREARALAQ